MQVGVMQSDIVVSGTLFNPEAVRDGGRMHAKGDLVIDSAVFGGVGGGDTLTLVWEYMAPAHLQGKHWGPIKSPADPDFSILSGHPAVWLLRRLEEGEVTTQWLHCCVWEFGSGTSRLWSRLDGPVIPLKNTDCDMERDWWKVEAVLEYLDSVYTESEVPERPQRSN